MIVASIVVLFTLGVRAPSGSTGLGLSAFRPDGSKLIVLVHGTTEPPGRTGDPVPGTLDHARSYWGYGFCARLVGAFSPDSRSLLPGPKPPPAGPPTAAQLARRLHSRSGIALSGANWSKAAVSEATVGDHFYQAGRTDEVPALTLMLTYRDGSKRLVRQAGAMIDQIYDQVHAQYPGEKPQLILAGHSMGGLVLRYALTEPHESISGESLTPSQKTKAAWLRRQTLYVVALASPHEGSPLAAKYQAIGTFMADKVAFLKGILKTVGFADADPQGWMAQTVGLTPALEHLRSDFWHRANQGALAPYKMTRPDGSGIPIYALSGRTPSGPYYADPNEFPSGGIDFQGDAHRTFKALGLMLLDWGLRNAPGSPQGWGGLVRPAGINFDQVRRGNTELSLSGRRFVSPPAPVPLLNCDGLPFFYVGGQGDGEPDTDGMVSIQSALGNRLGTATDLFFDHGKTWKVGDKIYPGSWYRLPTGPWNGANHDTICHAPAIADWLRVNLFEKAGPLAGTGPVSVWP